MITMKSIAYPAPSVGQDYSKEKELTVPDQSMSLQEILLRFTRNETLPIGKDVNYHDSPDDLEKLAHVDLVDKQEFAEKLEETKKNFDKQEKKKAEKLRLDALKKIEDEERAKLANGGKPEPAK